MFHDVKFDSEKIIFSITACLCILIPVLDFLGALDNIGWLHNQLQNMTLIAIGLIGLSQMTANSKHFEYDNEKLEEIAKKLGKITFNDLEHQLIARMNELQTAENQDIARFFGKAWQVIGTAKTREQKVDILKTFSQNCRQKFISGDVMGNRQQGYPWDFTISLIDLNGVMIDHDNPEMIGTIMWGNHPWQDILDKRNGNFIWPDSFKSARMDTLITRGCPVSRLTKFNFQTFADVDVILVLEVHFNIVCQLPPIPLCKNNDHA